MDLMRSYVGWGREDSDLVVRLINNNVFRKEAIFSTGMFHETQN